jgi:hypothetical protein
VPRRTRVVHPLWGFVPLTLLFAAAVAFFLAAIWWGVSGHGPFLVISGVAGSALSGWCLWRVAVPCFHVTRDLRRPSSVPPPVPVAAPVRVAAGGIDRVPDVWIWQAMLRLAWVVDCGQLKHSGILAAAARGALFIDLVCAGVIKSGPAGLTFDTGPLDIPLGDNLIAELRRRPNRTLSDHIQRGRPHLSDFTAELVRGNMWRPARARVVPPRYLAFDDLDPLRYWDLADTITAIGSGRLRTVDSHAAALAALAVVMNLRKDPRPRIGEVPSDLLVACGAHAWIVRDVTTYLIGLQRNDLAAGRSSRTNNAWPLGSL